MFARRPQFPAWFAAGRLRVTIPERPSIDKNPPISGRGRLLP